MKVGTDGVLLGAWVNLCNVVSILDMGSGTGVISLMMAQRSPLSHVLGVELDADAAAEAALNVQNSSFQDRVRIQKGDVRTFTTEKGFELILSNPPFFNGTFGASGKARNQARHQETLSLKDLIVAASRLGAEVHRLALILPKEVAESGSPLFEKAGYHLSRECQVKPTPEKPVHRLMQEWSSESVEKPAVEELTIELSRHRYSDEYKKLCREFYLNF